MKITKKYTYEYITSVCDKKGMKLQKIYYSYDKNNKKRKMVDFICKKHFNFGVQSIVCDKIDKTKRPCKYCGNSVLLIKDIVSIKNPNVEILSDCNDIQSESRLKCRCNACGYEWETVARALLAGTGCKMCGYKKIWEKREKLTTEIVKERIKKINPNIEVVGEYKGSHEYIKCKCLIHNFTWKSIFVNVCNGSARCPMCGKENVRNACALTNDDFYKKITSKYSHIKPLEKYVNREVEIKFLCIEHNFEFYSKPKAFLYGHSNGCPICTQSYGERTMLLLLEQNGFNIKPQYSFDDCIYINKLRFDAYDENKRVAFEFQGRQHYEPINFFGGEESFKTCVERDEIKRQYCKNNNIKLIEIPYWEVDNMDEFIKNNI